VSKGSTRVDALLAWTWKQNWHSKHCALLKIDEGQIKKKCKWIMYHHQSPVEGFYVSGRFVRMSILFHWVQSWRNYMMILQWAIVCALLEQNQCDRRWRWLILRKCSFQRLEERSELEKHYFLALHFSSKILLDLYTLYTCYICCCLYNIEGYSFLGCVVLLNPSLM
jgi:hypothetical protein